MRSPAARPPENPRNSLRIFTFSESTSAVAELRTVLAFGRLAPTAGDSRGMEVVARTRDRQCGALQADLSNGGFAGEFLPTNW